MTEHLGWLVGNSCYQHHPSSFFFYVLLQMKRPEVFTTTLICISLDLVTTTVVFKEVMKCSDGTVAAEWMIYTSIQPNFRGFAEADLDEYGCLRDEARVQYVVP